MTRPEVPQGLRPCARCAGYPPAIAGPPGGGSVNCRGARAGVRPAPPPQCHAALDGGGGFATAYFYFFGRPYGRFFGVPATRAPIITFRHFSTLKHMFVKAHIVSFQKAHFEPSEGSF